MKKIYLIFLLLSCFSLVLISFINSKKDALIYTENSNNLKKLIDDSIKPHCSNNLNTSYKNLINPYKEFIINIPNSRKWSRNLYKAYVQNSSVITENYKKRFDAFINFKKSKNEICQLPARIRISGDLKDHIQLKNGDIFSSLDISLKEGNINGITKFKLFLPSTRNGSSEVFISLFLKEMGYLSPRTNFVNVTLNNRKFKMIFQEKATKEMLEHNKLRESAILESDESLMWAIRSKGGSLNSGNIFPRIINKKWIKRNKINQSIGLEGAQYFSKAILESWNKGGIDRDITFSDILLSNYNVKNKKILSTYRAHLLSSRTDHALYSHNRRFYYDPINKAFLPIYYDGNSRIRNLNKTEIYSTKYFKDRFLTRDLENEDYDRAIDEIDRINLTDFILKLNSSGVKINKSELIEIKKQLINNLISLKSANKVNLKLKFENDPLSRKIQNGIIYGLVLYSNKDDLFYLCNIKEDQCTKNNLNFLELNKLLEGEYFKENMQYFFIGNKFDPANKKYYDENPNKLNLINPSKNVFIKKFGNPEIIFNKDKKLISIKIKNHNEKILFLNSKLNGWDIRVFSNDSNKVKTIGSRIDTNLLTSLITIKDSYLNNLKIYIQGGHHEDSLNIINSFGSIDNITIKKSFQDAIDFDFSNLRVNEIYVKRSGNDCIDTSSGQYFISKLSLNSCKDKAISIGEKSTLRVIDAEIKNSNIALVSKDSSKLFIENAYLKNNNICGAAYNKKQEFGPSFISIPSKLCPKEKLAIQNLSNLEIK